MSNTIPQLDPASLGVPQTIGNSFTIPDVEEDSGTEEVEESKSISPSRNKSAKLGKEPHRGPLRVAIYDILDAKGLEDLNTMLARGAGTHPDIDIVAIGDFQFVGNHCWKTLTYNIVEYKDE